MPPTEAAAKLLNSGEAYWALTNVAEAGAAPSSPDSRTPSKPKFSKFGLGFLDLFILRAFYSGQWNTVNVKLGVGAQMAV